MTNTRANASVQEQAYAEIKRGLMTGAFMPGQAISLRDLAARLDTSSMPVRQAVHRLVAERALEMRPNRTFVVPRMSREKFEEITHWRCKLEGEAAAAACRNADQALIDTLRDLDRAILEALAKESVPDILESNRRFHFALYDASGSRVLKPLIESLWLQMGPFTYFSYVSALSDSLWDRSHHEQVIDALLAGQPEQCARAIKDDIMSIAGFLVETQDFDNVGLPTGSLKRITRQT